MIRNFCLRIILFNSLFYDTFSSEDPYEGIDYHTIFNQMTVFHKFENKKIKPQILKDALLKDLNSKKKWVAYSKIQKEVFVLIGATFFLGIPSFFVSCKIAGLLRNQLFNLIVGFIKNLFSTGWDISHPCSDPLYKWERLYRQKNVIFLSIYRKKSKESFL
jgi:hypothetical protein